MFPRNNRRTISPINTTSTADISFILLVFFLLMTSMDTDKGLVRQLPPIDNNERQEEIDVNKSNILSLQITASNRLRIDGKPLEIDKLRSHIIKFISEKSDINSHVIMLDVDRHASYNAYFNVQNEITAAYNTLRNKYALRTYGKVYAGCTTEQRKAIRKHYPQRIIETTTETRNGGGE